MINLLGIPLIALAIRLRGWLEGVGGGAAAMAS
jgi:hypothetical protein